MVLPESPSPETGSGHRSRGALFVGIGALFVGIGALAAGAVLVVSLTAPDPIVAAEASTTTSSSVPALETPIDLENFTIDQIATRPPLDWELSLSGEGSQPLGPVSNGGWVYIIAPEGDVATGATRFLTLRSSDGASWSSLGTLETSGGWLSGPVVTSEGIVVVESGTEAGFDVWRSTDGVVWVRTEVTVPHDDGDYIFNVHAVGGTDDLIAVVGTPYMDESRRLAAALADHGHDPGLADNWTITMEDPGPVFTFYGPLGLPITTMNAGELGFTGEEFEMIAGYAGEPPAELWVSRDEGEFTKVAIEDVYSIYFITAGPGGTLFASGSNGITDVAWRSNDGLEWESVTAANQIWDTSLWDDRLIGPANTGALRLYQSFDGSRWEQVDDLIDIFPRALDWSLSRFAVGEAGLVLTADAYIANNDTSQIPPPRPAVILRKDGFVLSLDLEYGHIELTSPSDVVTTWLMYNGNAPQPGLEVDATDEVVRFTSEDATVEFGFDELTEAETRYWESTRMSFSPASHSAFVFTRDGTDWTITDFGVMNIPGWWAYDVSITDDRALTLLTDSQRWQIWSAPLPTS